MNAIHEQIHSYGVANTHDAILLSAIIGNETSVKELLKKYKDLWEISQCSLSELQKVKGISYARATKLKAVFEIARRYKAKTIKPGVQFSGSKMVFCHYRSILGHLKKEHFYVVLLDTKHRIIKEELVSIGCLNFAVVHPREIFLSAIKESAESIILVHNHPSSSVIPSQEDIELTQRLVKVGNLVGIKVLDHVIIGANSYTSFQEENLLGEKQC